MNRANKRFGRRGVLLILLGIPWILYGIGIIEQGPIDRFSRPGPGGPLDFLDSPMWGLMFLIGGITSVVSAFLRVRISYRTNHRPIMDEIGFNGLIIPLVIWVAAYAWSWLSFVVSGGEFGRGNSYLAMLIFAAYLNLILFITSWPDPDDPATLVTMNLRKED